MDAVCHQAVVVGHGLDPPDAPRYAHHNDFGTAVLLAAMAAAVSPSWRSRWVIWCGQRPVPEVSGGSVRAEGWST